MFDTLVEKVKRPQRRERAEKKVDQAGYVKLIDEKTRLQREGKLDIKESRKLSRRIKAPLREDRRERARRAGEEVMGHLKLGRVREAWGWHLHGEANQGTRRTLRVPTAPGGEKPMERGARRRTTAHPQTKSFGGQPCVVGVGSLAAQAPCGPRI